MVAKYDLRRMMGRPNIHTVNLMALLPFDIKLNSDGRFYRHKIYLLMGLMAVLAFGIPINLYMVLLELILAPLRSQVISQSARIAISIPLVLGLFLVGFFGMRLWFYGIAKICKAGNQHPQLFPTSWERSMYSAVPYATPETDSRAGAKILRLLQSNERTEVQEGIRLARATKRWEGWSLRAMPQTFSYGTTSPVQVEELLKAGALVNHYDSDFNPITFLACSPTFQIYSELLVELLSAGADINDEDLNGKTLLDFLVSKLAVRPNSNQFDCLIEDIDQLVSKGARVVGRTADPLRNLDTTDPSKLTIARLAVSKLDLLALRHVARTVREDSQRQEVLEDPARRAL